MIGIKMKPNIPVHYQKGEHITEGLPPPPPIFIFISYGLQVLQEKIIPPPTNFYF